MVQSTPRGGLGIETHGALEMRERDAGQRAGKNASRRPQYLAREKVRKGMQKQGERKEGRGGINAGRKECRRGKEGPSREQKQREAGSRLSRKQGGVVGAC